MIKEVVLRRFKRFEEGRFDLSGHVILAGPNNCGKTTVLQAIAAWSLALKTWKQLNDYQRHGGFYTKAPITKQAFSAVPLRSFDLLWKDRNYTGAVQIEVITMDNVAVTMEFESNSTDQIFVRPRNNIPPQFLGGFSLEVVYVATVGGLSLEEPVYQPDYIETLLGRQKPGDVIRNLLFQASKGNAWELLTKSVNRLFGVQLLVPLTPGGQIVCEYQSGDGPKFDLLSAGSGFQQVVLLLASLFTRKGSVVLVDEPDAHLHVFLQDSILYELNKAAAETSSQLVIATHSEVIFNSAEPTQICVMMGSKPRRLTTAEDVKKLQQAVAVLQQSDIVAALATPGILYLEGYTDLNLLREWARILKHPLGDYLNRMPFWRAKQPPGRPDAAEVPVRTHFDALKLVDAKITGVWLIDADGKAQNIQMSAQAEREKLNRVAWQRYETESYLVHPASLARFIGKQSGKGDADAVRKFLTGQFDTFAGAGLGQQIADAFIANPSQPSQLVQTYLANTKARTQIVGGILQESGVHGMNYTEFHQIAAQMLPDEIHPEVKEKLDFIQQAFGL